MEDVKSTVKSTVKLINDRINQTKKAKNDIKKIIDNINSQIESESETGYIYLEMKQSTVILTIPELGVYFKENINDLLINSQPEGIEYYVLQKINNMIKEVQ